MEEPTELDYYRVLGIGPTAALLEIRRAYRKKTLATHPDKNPGMNSTAFHRVQEAWETLRDEHKRYCFDYKYPRVKAEWKKYEELNKPQEENGRREGARDKAANNQWDFDEIKRTLDELRESLNRAKYSQPQPPPPPPSPPTPRFRQNVPRVCRHRRWWPRVYGVDSCEYCGRHCPIYTLKCPDCDARACVPCKIRESGG
ncbi:hypothetical protein AJ80_01595 [Polytolypa hystricis UAMH7299]|uniref:J domain-containing protein n=1 Tax=Polytolypa hystricis (strain UAMH7299) TaxID=1447883 RepID=A0A2B7YZR9_POLH7|nr:hypothetical protein AJ80_01595 [Polytolypa hystricis UAMH7299]